jgi:hypothetical protein
LSPAVPAAMLPAPHWAAEQDRSGRDGTAGPMRCNEQVCGWSVPGRVGGALAG